jgi:SAM-dependent methyltransferase
MKDAVRERYAQLSDSTSLGLGDVVTLAGLRAGETVLDLGSGPGHDLLKAASLVGPSGRAIGVDGTPEMIESARASAAGVGNVSILDGDLERLPLHCGAVDVVISNCVINLVEDKKRALIEAYRVLRPGGRLAILDTAFEQEPSADVRADSDAWSCCEAGALVRDDYEAILKDIGYADVAVEWLEGSGCGNARAVRVTANKVGTPQHELRPAVPSDPIGGHRPEDTIVSPEGGYVVVERYGPSAMIRALHGEPKTMLIGAALDVARWSGATEVHATPDEALTAFEFEKTAPDRMRLDFEKADLPLIGKPSLKPLPTFQNGSCC